MEIITSLQNKWVVEAKKLQQKKYREAQGLFLVEGLRLTEEALKQGEITQVFYHEMLASTERGAALLKGLSGKARQLFQVSSKVLAALAETQTPQGIVAVVRKEVTVLKDFQPQGCGPLVLLDGLQEPGNLGTIIRTLWAGGGEGLLCLEGTADPYNSKSVRASMGGIFAMPILLNLKWDKIYTWARQQGYLLVAGDVDQAIDYRLVPWQPKTILCIGNEGRGFSQISSDAKLIRAKLPLTAGAESLNAAVAAGILLYETIRNKDK